MISGWTGFRGLRLPNSRTTEGMAGTSAQRRCRREVREARRSRYVGAGQIREYASPKPSSGSNRHRCSRFRFRTLRVRLKLWFRSESSAGVFSRFSTLLNGICLSDRLRYQSVIGKRLGPPCSQYGVGAGTTLVESVDTRSWKQTAVRPTDAVCASVCRAPTGHPLPLPDF